MEIMQLIITEHTMADGSNVVSSNEMSYQSEEDDQTATTMQIFRNFS